MAGNTFGKIFKITTFGESHGAALGVVIDGCPSGVKIYEEQIQEALDKRKPGGMGKDGMPNVNVTMRKEEDKVEILSGVLDSKEGYYISLGTPIALLIRNTNQNPKDYDALKDVFRPSHGDYTYFQKYSIRDHRGGGRASGRETAARVAAGAVAKMTLDAMTQGKIKVTAYTKEAAGVSCCKIDFSAIEQNVMRAADLEKSKLMEEKIASLRKEGDSAGGIIECLIEGVPAGLGEPVFEKLEAVLSYSMLGIGAVKGIEFGRGFDFAKLKGSTANDAMRVNEKGEVNFLSNNNGGILAGISNGQDIIFRLAIKPVPSIFLLQKTVAKDSRKNFYDTDLLIQGRHDVCLCPRIVPVVEAMAYLVLCDMALQNLCAEL